MRYVYNLIGIVEKKEVKNDGSYLLTTNLNRQKYLIQVFKEKLANQQIWTDLENNSFLGKLYIFHCQNWMGRYRLINWKELNNPSQENKKDYGSN